MVLKILAIAIKQGKKSIPIGKVKVKLSLFADGKKLYVEIAKDSTENFELINEFNKVAGYKINKHKSVAFYILINYQKKKLRKQSHL